MPNYLVRKSPEGTLTLVAGDLPLDIVPPDGPGNYDLYALSDEVASVQVLESSQPPILSAAPAVTGTPRIGQTLTATPGSWAGADSVAGQWTREGAPIAL